METITSTEELFILAEELGLPCIEQAEIITVVGERQLIVFKQEENQCQLIEIY